MIANTELLTQVLSLPEPERVEFAHRLLLSLEPGEFDPNWRQLWADELAARYAAVASGQAVTRDWREVIADVKKELAKGTGT